MPMVDDIGSQSIELDAPTVTLLGSSSFFRFLKFIELVDYDMLCRFYRV